MPFDDPDPSDPSMLVGVEWPGDETVTRDMAVAFAEEFAQLGLDRERILALFSDPSYRAAYRAGQLLGVEAVTAIVDESLVVWGHLHRTVVDGDSGDGIGDDRIFDGAQQLVDRNGFLKVVPSGTPGTSKDPPCQP